MSPPMQGPRAAPARSPWVGRLLVAGAVGAIAIAGAAALFLVGRRLFGVAVGLVAAALLTFAFLPVTYSRIAVTDVGAFLPVAVAVWAALRVWEEGRLIHYL